ncbi:hypothetical protein ATSB10_03120 [Dyella thiooxydans]|uniref:DUF969 domain-containing protein n=1 Tax=Dyella thiooxydans TaxID=445710 RepID=A0A160MXA2_9GAMM|nr:DUF969 domain-containing protein [Dyella thiooxydans]AND67766.1 hypothetical protein ATSB10_03120 [Dyella thiooxydans]
MNGWPLLGVAVIALGFVLRFNPVLVVVTAAITSGLLSGMSVPDLLTLLGTSFASSRILLIIVMTLPAIGLLERAGLREHARAWMERLRGMTLARLLIGYLLGRQLLSMIGLQSVAGPAQTVRPLLAPMAEAAAARIDPDLPEDERDRLRALCAATDNVGLFFGEDVFIALGAVLLIQGFYSQHGIELTPLSIALWALPTAIAAFVVHGVRIALFQRHLRRRVATRQET